MADGTRVGGKEVFRVVGFHDPPSQDVSVLRMLMTVILSLSSRYEDSETCAWRYSQLGCRRAGAAVARKKTGPWWMDTKPSATVHTSIRADDPGNTRHEP